MRIQPLSTFRLTAVVLFCTMRVPVQYQYNPGGSSMSDRFRKMSNPVIINEAIIASLIGLFIITQPVARRKAPEL